MSGHRSPAGDPKTAASDGAVPDVTDAPADIGDTSDLAEAERLEEDRARRQAADQPDLPDRAFDRITPQV
ncbi:MULTISPECIES: hypothetical protein [unclassified Aureimonas]|uniref:hypothetical protein n=1 Tax=unclassified Aureimonas TaxID=2615206 RepID=UPI000715E7CA|nr:MULTISPECIES: hypothetical protein [unclassified Aureimonas]KQT79144.1 hypothetical protein ASG54_08835 [Aureimonas sp. Leaf460]